MRATSEGSWVPRRKLSQAIGSSSCGPARWQAKVTRAAEHTVASAARGAYARTLLFNLLVLLVSGAIVTAHARRTRRLPAG